MLARLDEIPGVAESRVDWTGRRFLLTLQAGVAESVVENAALDALGEGAQVLSENEEQAALDAYRQGEAWMRQGETTRLSRYEAGVLAERYGKEAAEEMGLGEDGTSKLVALFEAEFVRAFDRVHEGTRSASLQSEFQSAAQRILDSSGDSLTPEQQAQLEEYLKKRCGPRS